MQPSPLQRYRSDREPLDHLARVQDLGPSSTETLHSLIYMNESRREGVEAVDSALEAWCQNTTNVFQAPHL